MSGFAEGYIDVATRIAEFREKHPDGRLRPADPANPYRIETIDGQTWIVVVAAALREEDDASPGVGMAWEQYPGRTPYTRGSELQNAETSAWGRAIVAALAADTKRGVASADEVRNRSAEREPEPMDPATYDGLVRAIDVGATVTVDELRALYVEATRRGDTETAEAAKAAGQALKEAS